MKARPLTIEEHIENTITSLPTAYVLKKGEALTDVVNDHVRRVQYDIRGRTTYRSHAVQSGAYEGYSFDVPQEWSTKEIAYLFAARKQNNASVSNVHEPLFTRGIVGLQPEKNGVHIIAGEKLIGHAAFSPATWGKPITIDLSNYTLTLNRRKTKAIIERTPYTTITFHSETLHRPLFAPWNPTRLYTQIDNANEGIIEHRVGKSFENTSNTTFTPIGKYHTLVQSDTVPVKQVMKEIMKPTIVQKDIVPVQQAVTPVKPLVQEATPYRMGFKKPGLAATLVFAGVLAFGAMFGTTYVEPPKSTKPAVVYAQSAPVYQSVTPIATPVIFEKLPQTYTVKKGDSFAKIFREQHIDEHAAQQLYVRNGKVTPQEWSKFTVEQQQTQAKKNPHLIFPNDPIYLSLDTAQGN